MQSTQAPRTSVVSRERARSSTGPGPGPGVAASGWRSPADLAVAVARGQEEGATSFWRQGSFYTALRFPAPNLHASLEEKLNVLLKMAHKQS